MSMDYAGDSSSSLTGSILGTIATSASAIALAATGNNTRGQVPSYSRPVIVSSSGGMKSSSLLLIAVLAVAGVLVYKKL